MLNYKTISLLFAIVIVGLAAASFAGLAVVPWWSFAVAAAIYTGIVSGGVMILSWQFFVPVKSGGDIGGQAIAITFDDGPFGENTEKILDLLRLHKTPAAFFCIGHRVAKNPELARRLHLEGHLIGNHSYWHKSTFDLQTAGKIADELTGTNLAIREATGLTPRFFRPPYGITNPMVAKAIRRGGFATIGWSVRSFDTISRDPEALFKRVTANLKGGDIVLFHDYCSITIDILPRFLDHIAATGLKIVRVDELLRENAYAG